MPDGLSSFFERIREDPRIGMSHVALYTALLSLCQGDGYIRITMEEMTERCKMGQTRYFQCLNELAEYGYIEYEPVRYKGRSRVRVKGARR